MIFKIKKAAIFAIVFSIVSHAVLPCFAQDFDVDQDEIEQFHQCLDQKMGIVKTTSTGSDKPLSEEQKLVMMKNMIKNIRSLYTFMKRDKYSSFDHAQEIATWFVSISLMFTMIFDDTTNLNVEELQRQYRLQDFGLNPDAELVTLEDIAKEELRRIRGVRTGVLLAAGVLATTIIFYLRYNRADQKNDAAYATIDHITSAKNMYDMNRYFGSKDKLVTEIRQYTITLCETSSSESIAKTFSEINTLSNDEIKNVIEKVGSVFRSNRSRKLGLSH